MAPVSRLCRRSPRPRAAGRLTLGVAVFFFVSQTCLYGVAEANFWRERRRTSDERRDEMISLARLPLPRPAGLARSASFPFPSLDAAAAPGRYPAPIADLSASLSRFGTVKEIHVASDNAPIVVHLQDVHEHEGAQRSLAHLVEAAAAAGVRLVGLEGAAGFFAVDPFRSYPSAAVTRGLADAFLKAGYLGGPEFAAVTLPRPPMLWGVEDPAAYARNVESLRVAHGRRAELEAWLRREERRVAELRSRISSPALRSYDRAFHAFHSGGPLLPYVENLLRLVGSPRPPVLAAFAEAAGLERTLDFAQVERLRTSLLSRLGERVNEAEMRSLLALARRSRSGDISGADFYRVVVAVGRRHGVTLVDHPALAAYSRYVELASGITAADLDEAIRASDRRVVARLASAAPEKEAVEAGRRVVFIRKLVAHQLTPGEWRDYRRLPPPAVDLAPFEGFYAWAERRNAAMVRSLLERMDDVGARRAVLVAGGFHTPGLADLLRKNEVSYLVVAPRFENIVPTNDATDVFVRKPLPLERVFAGETLHLAAPRLLAARPLESGVRARTFAMAWHAGQNELIRAEDPSASRPSESPLPGFTGARRAGVRGGVYSLRSPDGAVSSVRVEAVRPEEASPGLDGKAEDRVDPVARLSVSIGDGVDRRDYVLHFTKAGPETRSFRAGVSLSSAIRGWFARNLWWEDLTLHGGAVAGLAFGGPTSVFVVIVAFVVAHLRHLARDHAAMVRADIRVAPVLWPIIYVASLASFAGAVMAPYVAAALGAGAVATAAFAALSVATSARHRLWSRWARTTGLRYGFAPPTLVRADGAMSFDIVTFSPLQPGIRGSFGLRVHEAAVPALLQLPETAVSPRAPPFHERLPDSYPEELRPMIDTLIKNQAAYRAFKRVHNNLFTLMPAIDVKAKEGPGSPVHFIRRYRELVRIFSRFDPLPPEIRSAAVQAFEGFEARFEAAAAEGEAALGGFLNDMQDNWTNGAGERTAETADTLNKFLNWMHAHVEEKVIGIGKFESADTENPTVVDIVHMLDPTRHSIALDFIGDVLSGRSSSVEVVVNESSVWVSELLGTLHRMQAVGLFIPPDIGGYIEFVAVENATDPRNFLRREVAEKVFRSLGFKLSTDEPSDKTRHEKLKQPLVATYGKDEGARSVDDLVAKWRIGMRFQSGEGTGIDFPLQFIRNTFVGEGYNAVFRGRFEKSAGRYVRIDPLIAKGEEAPARARDQEAGAILDDLTTAWAEKIVRMGATASAAEIQMTQTFYPEGGDMVDEEADTADAVVVPEGHPATEIETPAGRRRVWLGHETYMDTQLAEMNARFQPVYDALQDTLRAFGLDLMPETRPENFTQPFINQFFNDVVARAASAGRIVRTPRGFESNPNFRSRSAPEMIIDHWTDVGRRGNMVAIAPWIRDLPIQFAYTGRIGSAIVKTAELNVLEGRYVIHAAYLEASQPAAVVLVTRLDGTRLTKEEAAALFAAAESPPAELANADDDAIQLIETAFRETPQSLVYPKRFVAGEALIAGSVATGELVFGDDLSRDGKIVFVGELDDESVYWIRDANGMLNAEGNALDHRSLLAHSEAGGEKPRIVASAFVEGEDEQGPYLSISSYQTESPTFLSGYAIVTVQETRSDESIRLRAGDLITLDGENGLVYWANRDESHSLFRAFKALRALSASVTDKSDITVELQQLSEFLRGELDQGRPSSVNFVLRVLLLGERVDGKLHDASLLERLLSDPTYRQSAQTLFQAILAKAESLRASGDSGLFDFIQGVYRFSRAQMLDDFNRYRAQVRSAPRVDAVYHVSHALRRQMDDFARTQALLGVTSPGEEIDLAGMKAEWTREVGRHLTYLSGQLRGMVDRIGAYIVRNGVRAADVPFLVRLIERAEEFERIGLPLGRSAAKRIEIIGRILAKREAEIAEERAARGLTADPEPGTTAALAVDLADLDNTLASLVGNKAANLGWLIKFSRWLVEVLNGGRHAGFRVPDGFALTVHAFDLFLRQHVAGREFGTLRQAIREVLESNRGIPEKSQMIKDMIMATSIPPELVALIRSRIVATGGAWAIRSSTLIEDDPIQSAAGVFESKLGPNSPARVLAAVKETWASLYSSRALYRYGAELASAKQGVVIQQLVEPRGAGVMTSANLSTQNRGEVVINAGWGLGESIVQNLQEADRTLVNAVTGEFTTAVGDKRVKIVRNAAGETEIADVAPKEQRIPVLSNYEVRRLTDIAVEAERWFAYVADIEWAVDDDASWMLQIRPVPDFKVLPDDKAHLDQWLGLGKSKSFGAAGASQPLGFLTTWPVVAAAAIGSFFFGGALNAALLALSAAAAFGSIVALVLRSLRAGRSAPGPVWLYGRAAVADGNAAFVRFVPSAGRYEIHPFLHRLLGSRYATARLLGHLAFILALAPLHEPVHSIDRLQASATPEGSVRWMINEAVAWMGPLAAVIAGATLTGSAGGALFVAISAAAAIQVAASRRGRRHAILKTLAFDFLGGPARARLPVFETRFQSAIALEAAADRSAMARDRAALSRAIAGLEDPVWDARVGRLNGTATTTLFEAAATEDGRKALARAIARKLADEKGVDEAVYAALAALHAGGGTLRAALGLGNGIHPRSLGERRAVDLNFVGALVANAAMSAAGQDEAAASLRRGVASYNAAMGVIETANITGADFAAGRRFAFEISKGIIESGEDGPLTADERATVDALRALAGDDRRPAAVILILPGSDGLETLMRRIPELRNLSDIVIAVDKNDVWAPATGRYSVDLLFERTDQTAGDGWDLFVLSPHDWHLRPALASVVRILIFLSERLVVDATAAADRKVRLINHIRTQA